MKKVFFTTLFLILGMLPAIASASVIGKPANNLGLIGYWPMSEGAGTRIDDSSGFGNFGTTTNNPTWVNGKFGQALHFDGNGVDNYMKATTTTSWQNLKAITVSAWIKATSPGTNLSFEAHIVDKSDCHGDKTSGTFELLQDPGGTPDFAVYDGVNTAITSNSAPASTDDGKWHLLTGEYDGSNNVSIYVDGVFANSQSGVGAFTLESSSTPFDIGGYCAGKGAITDNFYNGTIDDVRVYKRALPASEIANLYKYGASRTGVSSASLDNSSSLASGLVGHWTMDGVDTIYSIVDRSGQGNNGGFIGGATSSAKVQGVLGQALNFAQPGSYVATPFNPSLYTNITVSMWVKITGTPDSTSAAGRFLFSSSDGGTNRFYIRTINGNATDLQIGLSSWSIAEASAIKLNTWALYTLVLDGTNGYFYVNGTLFDSTTGLTVSLPNKLTDIGNAGPVDSETAGASLIGSIDDARVYNRALSASEVKQLYNLGGQKITSSQNLTNGTTLKTGLVGLWSFDGLNVSDKVYDTSGQGNNGYFVGGATSSAKVQGKMGQALNFDGAQTFVDVPLAPSLDITGNNATVAAWFKVATSTAGMGRILAIPEVETAGSEKLGIFIQADNARFIVGHNGTADIVDFAFSDTSNWHQLVGTYDGVTARIYLDGVQKNFTNVPSPGALDGSNVGTHLQIGRFGPDWSQYFGGKVDDVRVYNRTLSASEVKQLYNLGK